MNINRKLIGIMLVFIGFMGFFCPFAADIFINKILWYGVTIVSFVIAGIMIYYCNRLDKRGDSC